MRMLKSAVQPVVDVATLLGGGLWYAFAGHSSPTAYQAMVRLFCRTGGVSNDVMSRLLSAWGRHPSLPAPQGDLGVQSAAAAARIADRIRTDGYYIFEERLPPAVCDRLLSFALQTRSSVRPMTRSASAQKRLEIYDRAHPLAVRYDFRADDVLGLPDVQDLMANPTILSVAQSYLQTTPIADVVSMWWHTGYSHRPDEDAGQLFHFDMDRIKWLKYFIYLTDVGSENGPHCFVKGSHRTGGIPRELLAQGYSRLTDEQVLRHYPKERVVEFVAPRGTVLAEDTRGLHKGREILDGDRLMLQIQFSSSLFGGLYPRASFRAMGPRLEQMARSYPRIYKNYLKQAGV